jgi:flagellin
MPMNVVSNYAANVAHRNLAMTDTQATNSLARLSIGKRVLSARDDAASMAIGSRMSSEIQGLKQAVVNAGQANSMLQIADGAMGNVSDVLTRMKTLAVQASSGNLSATERQFLNVEFQALVEEVDRIADNSNFNGTKLLDGSIAITAAAGFEPTDGIAAISAQGVATGANDIAYTADTAAGTYTFTATAGGVVYTGTIDSSVVSVDTNGDATLLRATTIQLAPPPGEAGSITISLNNAFDAGTNIAAAASTFAGSTELELSFKLGAGTSSSDSLAFTLNGVGTGALGLTGQSIDEVGNANSALEAVNAAIDTLNAFRADIGAAQNRLDFAANNLNVSIENAEAARSTLLDLDVAAEITNFTSKQILLQTGTAMLAQANQLPQNLLRLLQ